MRECEPCVRAYVCACACEGVRAGTCVSVLGGGCARRGGACVKDPGEAQAQPDVTALTRGLGDGSPGRREQVSRDAFGGRFQVGELEVTPGATRGFQRGRGRSKGRTAGNGLKAMWGLGKRPAGPEMLPP